MRFSRIVLHVSLVAVGGLATVGSSVDKRRAAVVPHMVPTPRSGQNIHDGRGQVYVENSIVTRARNPTEAPDANAGLYIPRYQIGGGARLRLGENWDLGLLFEYGLRKGAITVAPDVPPGPDHGAIGFGLSVGYSIPATRYFRIGLVLDTLLYAIPYMEYIASECQPPFTNCGEGEKNINVVPVLSLSVLPSFRVTPWLVLFTGITLRNHPTIEKHSVETIGDDNDVKVGPANVTLGAGAEFQLHPQIRFLLHAYWPVTRDPVVYYPVIGAGLSFSFGRPYRAPAPVKPCDPPSPNLLPPPPDPDQAPPPPPPPPPPPG